MKHFGSALDFRHSVQSSSENDTIATSALEKPPWSYRDFWCMGEMRRWRILRIDSAERIQSTEVIRHEQFYP